MTEERVPLSEQKSINDILKDNVDSLVSRVSKLFFYIERENPYLFGIKIPYVSLEVSSRSKEDALCMLEIKIQNYISVSLCEDIEAYKKESSAGNKKTICWIRKPEFYKELAFKDLYDFYPECYEDEDKNYLFRVKCKLCVF